MKFHDDRPFDAQTGGLAPMESPDGKYLYYAKNLNQTSLWRIPVGGGEETQILESLTDFSSFAVTDQGIYFSPTVNAGENAAILFLSFASGLPKTVAVLDKPIRLGLAVSADQQWLLYAQREVGHDLMLVEKFH